MITRPHEVAYAEVEDPVVGPDDVLVRRRLAGVCRTDVDVARGILTDPRWVRLPCIPSHDWAGTVAAVGERVNDVSPGDGVVCEGIVPCTRCPRCKRGETNLCERYDQLGFARPGGYGELACVPRQVVHRLPDSVSFQAAVLGIAGEGRTLELPSDRVALRDLQLIGSVGYTTAAWARVVRLASQGLFDPAPIVTHRFPVGEFERAFALLERRQGVVGNVVIDHSRV